MCCDLFCLLVLFMTWPGFVVCLFVLLIVFWLWVCVVISWLVDCVWRVYVWRLCSLFGFVVWWVVYGLCLGSFV